MGKEKKVKSKEVVEKESDAILKDESLLPAKIEEQPIEESKALEPSQQSTSIDLITQKYVSASVLKLTKDEEEKLAVPVDLLDINVRPDGLIYYPQVFVRDRLNDAFGRGAWALIEHQVIKDEAHNKIYFEGSLYVRGCFVAKAIGEANYFPVNQQGQPNKMFSWASAHESAKSDCIVRCGKDLGIGKELWQPRFSRDFLKDFCVKVWRKETGNTNQNGTWQKGSYQWRMKDSEPFWDENNDNKTPPKVEKEQSQKEEPKKETVNYKSMLEKAKTVLALKQVYRGIPAEQQTQKIIDVAKAQSEKLKKSLLIPINDGTTTFDLIDLLHNIETQIELNDFIKLNSATLDEQFGSNDQVRKEFDALKLRLKK